MKPVRRRRRRIRVGDAESALTPKAPPLVPTDLLKATVSVQCMGLGRACGKRMRSDGLVGNMTRALEILRDDLADCGWKVLRLDNAVCGIVCPDCLHRAGLVDTEEDRIVAASVDNGDEDEDSEDEADEDDEEEDYDELSPEIISSFTREELMEVISEYELNISNTQVPIGALRQAVAEALFNDEDSA